MLDEIDRMTIEAVRSIRAQVAEARRRLGLPPVSEARCVFCGRLYERPHTPSCRAVSEVRRASGSYKPPGQEGG